MPVPLLQAHLRMLPRLEAEESFAASQRIGVGMGSLKKDDRDGIVAGWRTALGRPAVERIRDRGAHAAVAAAAGIGVRIVKRPGHG